MESAFVHQNVPEKNVGRTVVEATVERVLYQRSVVPMGNVSAHRIVLGKNVDLMVVEEVVELARQATPVIMEYANKKCVPRPILQANVQPGSIVSKVSVFRLAAKKIRTVQVITVYGLLLQVDGEAVAKNAAVTSIVGRGKNVWILARIFPRRHMERFSNALPPCVKRTPIVQKEKSAIINFSTVGIRLLRGKTKTNVCHPLDGPAQRTVNAEHTHAQIVIVTILVGLMLTVQDRGPRLTNAILR